MPLAQTLTDVANLTLNSLGEGVIQNIESNGSTEIILRRSMSEIIRQVQNMVHWPEIIKVTTPTQASEMFDSSRYRYNLPTTLLEVVRVLNSSGFDVEGWEIIEGKLVTAEQNITLHYKYYTEVVTAWSPRMTEVIYRKLAVETCMQITNDPGMLRVMQHEYDLAKKEALTKIRTRSRNYKKNRTGFGYYQLRRKNFINKPIGYRS